MSEFFPQRLSPAAFLQRDPLYGDPFVVVMPAVAGERCYRDDHEMAEGERVYRTRGDLDGPGLCEAGYFTQRLEVLGTAFGYTLMAAAGTVPADRQVAP